MYGAWGDMYLKPPPPKRPRPKKETKKEGKKSFFSRRRKADPDITSPEQSNPLLPSPRSPNTIAVERPDIRNDNQGQVDSLLLTSVMTDATKGVHSESRSEGHNSRLQPDSVIEQIKSHSKSSAQDLNQHEREYQSPWKTRSPKDTADEVGFNVTWTEQDVRRMAREIAHQTIAGVHLSLFSYWIRAKPQNYELARVYIRELGLDQGYNVDRIDNEHLRKLVEDTCQVRPAYVAPSSPLEEQNNAIRETSTDQQESPALVTHTASLPGERSALLPRKIKTNSSDISLHSEPAYAASLHKKISCLSQRCSFPNLAGAARPASKSETVSRSLWTARQRVQALDLEEAKRLSPTVYSPWAYPPNTPDRPEPLSLKSRPSKASSINAVAAYRRSFSTPIHHHHSHSEEISPLPGYETYPRQSHLFQETFSHPLLTPTRNPSRRGKGEDSPTVTIAQHVVNEFAAVAKAPISPNDINLGRRYASTGHDSYPVTGPYELDDRDAGSDSEATYTVEANFDEVTSLGGDTVDSFFGDDADSELEPYNGFDEHSILETSSSIYSQDDGRVLYRFASPADGSTPEPIQDDEQTLPAVEDVAAPTKQSPRRRIRGPTPTLNDAQFHRPLPLRSYESEAHLYLTSRAQGGSHHGRHSSTGSLLHGSRPAPHTMGTPTSGHQSTGEPFYLLTPEQVFNGSGYFEGMANYDDASNALDYDHTEEEEPTHDAEHEGNTETNDNIAKDTHSQALSHTTGGASTYDFDSSLSKFPVPPTQNPVATLPMYLSRLKLPSESGPSSSRALPTNPPSYPPPLPPTDVAARHQTARENMRRKLRESQIYGSSLPDVNATSLSIFERTWRNVNEKLIVKIYGRKDVDLSEADVKYVEYIARQMRKDGISVEDLA